MLYITERCVFRLCEEGLELTEIAPGIDLERDILTQMDFAPVIKRPPRLMDARIFQSEPIGLRHDLLSIPLKQRLLYDAQQNLFFVNLEGMTLKNRDTIDRIRSLAAELLDPLGKKVFAIVNYDNFSIAPELMDDYIAMVRDLTQRFYSRVTRYTASTFMRSYFGQALRTQITDPALYATSEEALSELLNTPGLDGS